MNFVVISGKVAFDPRIHATDVRTIVNFVVEVRDGEYKKFIECTAFNGLAETLAPILKKGNEVLVNGSLTVRKFEQEGRVTWKTSVVAREVKRFVEVADNSQQEMKMEEDLPLF